MTRSGEPFSKRNRILSTAEQQFLERGFDGTSIDTIVEQAGGSKSTVYAHFRDKSILFAEALAEIRHEIDFSLSRFRASAPGYTTEALLLLTVELISVQFHQRALHLFRVVVSESNRFPEVARQYYEEGPAELVSQIGDFLSESLQAGAIHTGTAQAAAELLFSLSRGHRHMRVLLGLDPPPTPARTVAYAEEIVTRFVELVNWRDPPQ
ncbi:MAG TPA: TetR/AcrR family transcriptional regulator [Alkalispirochaeta sp.]|nr:TetR/AcrR family transcriptional regulator [Alkalispirochaeta sp.]